MATDQSQPLKIAMIGTRGVPAKYGGFETCVEEIGQRLVARGHDVTVYCRNGYYSHDNDSHLGMKRITLPNIPHKSLDTMSHTMLSVLHAMWQGYDIHMVFNAANSLLLFPLRLLGKQIAINTDGLEWKRTKWGYLGRSFYKFSEKIACLMANRLVTDSQGIRRYYSNRHNVDSTEIAYGAPIQYNDDTDALRKLELEPGKYFLQITRFEPENHPLLTINAFNQLDTDKKLVMVGCNPYPTDYTRWIEERAGSRTLLLGCVYDQDLLKALWCQCYAYIHGNSVGGTNPALLQTMASGCFTIANDNVFNRDVLGDCGIYAKDNQVDLSKAMQWALDNEPLLDNYRSRARQRIVDFYNWDRITDLYEQLFIALASGKYPWKIPWHVFFKNLTIPSSI